MGVIVKGSLLERLRRKELYIIFAIGVLMILMTCTGNASISVSGQNLVGFRNKLMIFQILINAFSCLLSVVLSMHTIPNEYERRNSHLVWIRGISQRKYHGSLCIANCIVNLIVLFVFYCMLAVFLVMNGNAAMLVRMIPAYLFTALNIVFVCVLTSAVSIKVPVFVTGLVGIFCVVAGVFYPLFSLMKNVLGGLGGKLIGGALKVIPNLHGVQNQAYRYLLGEEILIRKIIGVVVAIYVVTWAIMVWKREEA
ncbi:MAG: hypothetical protein Q4D51_03355 [Eubacteriales bacterium]|nr:hypothetical protein [Eubacteriales bacterium]